MLKEKEDFLIQSPLIIQTQSSKIIYSEFIKFRKDIIHVVKVTDDGNVVTHMLESQCEKRKIYE